MLRRVCGLIIAIILFSSTCSFALNDSKKYTGPFFTGCEIYQFGENEFILRLKGKDIPVPHTEVKDNSLIINFNGARAKKPEAIISDVEKVIETMPILHSFSILNFSDDKISIQIDANSPLSVHSSSRNHNGFTFRVKAAQNNDDIVSLSQRAAKPNVIFPETVLPFQAANRITIEFRDAELQDVFRLFMAALGRNIVLDASFPRDVLVTMTLVDVRIDEVMNYMLRTYDLACYSYGPNITAFGTLEGLYKLSGARSIKTFHVAYAEPAQAVTLLKNLAGLQDSEITVDERLRNLYINTNPARMQEVEDLMSKIDVPSKQVMIRASIFEFNESATRDVQATLNLVYDRWTFMSDPAKSTGSLIYDDHTYSQGRSNFDRYITAQLNALEAKEKGRTIANPSVIAIDGQEAKITLKQDIMYPAGRDDSGNPTWETEEVGPELTFTPKIEDNGYINLKIKINTGDYLGTDPDGNVITTDRDLETQIRVRDGMPFVVGGLFQDIETRNKSKIPILGDIPLLGRLFQYNPSSHTKTQAVMIVTPYILDTK